MLGGEQTEGGKGRSREISLEAFIIIEMRTIVSVTRVGVVDVVRMVWMCM